MEGGGGGKGTAKRGREDRWENVKINLCRASVRENMNIPQNPPTLLSESYTVQLKHVHQVRLDRCVIMSQVITEYLIAVTCIYVIEYSISYAWFMLRLLYHRIVFDTHTPFRCIVNYDRKNSGRPRCKVFLTEFRIMPI